MAIVRNFEIVLGKTMKEAVYNYVILCNVMNFVN
jgi:hypothetical protein